MYFQISSTGEQVNTSQPGFMLSKYRNTAEELDLQSRILAAQGNLIAQKIKPIKPSLSQDKLNSFDLIAICMALHHIKAPQFAISRLVERLCSNGVILVVDWAIRDAIKSLPSTHPAAYTVIYNGFTKD